MTSAQRPFFPTNGIMCQTRAVPRVSGAPAGHGKFTDGCDLSSRESHRPFGANSYFSNRNRVKITVFGRRLASTRSVDFRPGNLANRQDIHG